MNTENLSNQLFAGATALAGLILVFLGGIVSAYDAFPQEDRFAVRTVYRRRGALSLAGFLASLVSAIFALTTNWWAYPCLLTAAVLL